MITEIRLLKVPLEADYKHTIYFGEGAEGKKAQEVYFKARTFKAFDDLTYQRKDNKIRVPLHYDEVANNCNYVMYRNNTKTNGKWYFAFITKIEYVNDERTDVYIATDVIQTWYFDYKLKSCFVEREHTDNDKKGANTVPESLETGEYIVSAKHKYTPLTENVRYVIGATVDLRNTNFPNYGGAVYNGIASGVAYFYYESQADIETVLSVLATAGKSEAVVSVFMVPSSFITLDDTGVSKNLVLPSFAPNTKKWSSMKQITKPTTIDGYEPQNAKLLTFPYCYMLMSNNSGAGATYQYEYFSSNNCDFNINFALTPGCSIRLIPLNYKGVGENNEEGLTGGKFPIGGWTSDVYTNWLTQNALNLSVRTEQINQTMISAPFNGVTSAFAGGMAGAKLGPVGAAVGAIGGAVASGLGSVTSQYYGLKSIMAEKYAHSLQPAQASGNLNSGDVTCSNGDLTFTAYQMNIKKEYARIIDGYFSMYGYQVNRVKIPNKNHRRNYWYTKTIGCELDGAIPVDDIQIIKQCYDNGITFWKVSADTTTDIGVYCDNENNLIANEVI